MHHRSDSHSLIGMVASRLPTQLKTALIVIHRYSSAALCLLFAAWFISGVAMAYYRKPVLIEEQRLAFSEPLNPASEALAPAQLPELAATWHDTELLRLGQWQGRPLYRWRTTDAVWRTAWGDTGAPASFDGASLEPEAARWFGDGTPFGYDGAFYEQSQWSYFTEAREHYPLHRFSTEGRAPRQVFFSSRTGEPIVATTFGTRVLYYLGPGLHYFSFYPIRNNSALWRGLVNWSSGIGALTCLIGIVIGLWQLRWRAIGTDRRVVPYARRWMRWHHWTGLFVGLLTFTWVLSGLFSMNPAGIFPTTDVPATLESAFLGPQPPLSAMPSRAPNVDVRSGDAIKELEWKRLRGQSYVVARRDLSTTRLLWPDGNGFAERPPFSNGELMGFVRDLLPAPVRSVEQLNEFDDHYYARRDRHLPLPVLRVRLQDEHSTWYYLDPATGQLFLKSDDGTRVRRWLYNGLHSFDMQFLLRRGRWWDVTIWLLSLFGLALSVTGVVIAWQWIQRSVGPALAASAAGDLPKGAHGRLRPLNELHEGKVD